MKQEKLLTISEASKLLGVAKSTLRRWEEEGKLIPDVRTKGGQRRYKLSSLRPEMKHKTNYNRKTIAYARVSSHDPCEAKRLQGNHSPDFTTKIKEKL